MPTTIINASAGSGKTYRLAVAYLQALLSPLPDGTLTQPSQVLATTFTRAAASEILERVLRRLALAVLSEKERRQLLTEIGHPELDQADLAKLLASMCQALPQLQIGTIDALFARMVRVLGLDLSFPSNWTVADEIQAEELALDAADRLLRGPGATAALAQWQRFNSFQSSLKVRAALVDLLEETRFLLLESPLTDDNPDLAGPLKLPSEEMETARQALADLDSLPRTKEGKPNAHWVNDLKRLTALFAAESTLIRLLTNKLIRSCGQEDPRHRGQAVPPALRDVLAPWVQRAREDLQRLHQGRLPALAALARSYHDFRQLVAFARAAYRFPEVETAARLLPPHLSPDDLYFRLDSQVQHLLLDEFQDTSLSQFRFLWPLIEEIRANNRQFFAVGDVKQSIYGWRGADRHLLNQLPGWLNPEGRDSSFYHGSLDDNRRSSPALLQALDRLWGRLDQLSCLDPATYQDEREREQARIRRQAAASFLSRYRMPEAAGDNRYRAGRARLLITPAREDETMEEREAGQMEAILDAVEHHRREDARREIAILCRRRKWIPSLIAQLRERGIEASGEGGNPVADSAAVELVLSMLTWTDHPGHSLARAHVELSGLAHVFGFIVSQPNAALPRRTQAEVIRNGLAAVVSNWVRHDEFSRRGTAHDQVRCQQLVELARAWDDAGGGRLSRFVARVRSQRLDSPISSRVRIMTIHGAKGLEFETVILADLQNRNSGGSSPRFVVSMNGPTLPPEIHLLPNREDAEILGLEKLHHQYQQNQFEEDLSVLYVALTRAQSFLDVVIPAAEKVRPSLTGILGEAWDHREAGTYLIEEFTPPISAPARAPQTVVGDDPALWKMGADLGLPNFQATPDRLSPITPSGKEGAGVVKLGLLLNSANSLALEKGTAVHALLSRIAWSDSLPSLRDWIASIPEREARPDACRTAAAELYPRLQTIPDPLHRIFDAACWLQLWRDSGVSRLQTWRERRFAVVLDRELLNGSFDRVVLGLDAHGQPVRAHILDFKTDRIAHETDREERHRFYQPQLEAYAQALQKLLGLPATAIQTELVWIY